MSLLPPKPQNQRYLPDTGLNLTGLNGPDYFTSNVLQTRRQREARGQEGRGESALWCSQSPTAKATETAISDSDPLPRDATLGGSRRFHDCKISMDMNGHENCEPSFSVQSSSTQPAVSPSTSSRLRALPSLSPLPKQPKLKIGRHGYFSYGEIDSSRSSPVAGHPSPPLMSLRFGPVGF
ncbi:hypothetical protein ARMSODRAFT_511836 [Armillaria solidipes]|uniref:Uncharacterized protein n=1 Tax=Armillaria solidipes TaxID=1076256 RepID=A0A2H3C7L2_9AGAR|nr:hypothetical protein ARMSODRAFT_511836 [Armillaria solidipes]